MSEAWSRSWLNHAQKSIWSCHKRKPTKRVRQAVVTINDARHDTRMIVGRCVKRNAMPKWISIYMCARWKGSSRRIHWGRLAMCKEQDGGNNSRQWLPLLQLQRTMWIINQGRSAIVFGTCVVSNVMHQWIQASMSSRWKGLHKCNHQDYMVMSRRQRWVDSLCQQNFLNGQLCMLKAGWETYWQQISKDRVQTASKLTRASTQTYNVLETRVFVLKWVFKKHCNRVCNRGHDEAPQSHWLLTCHA